MTRPRVNKKPGDDDRTLPPIPDSMKWDELDATKPTPDERREAYLTRQAAVVVEYAKTNRLTDKKKKNLVRAFEWECLHLTTAVTKDLSELESIPHDKVIGFSRRRETFVDELINAVSKSVNEKAEFDFDEWFLKHSKVYATAPLLWGLELNDARREHDRLMQENALLRWVLALNKAQSSILKGDGAKGQLPDSPKARSFTPGQLTGALGVSLDTLNHYAKAAEVRTPGRGERNFLYTEEATLKILGKMKKRSDKRIRDNATRVLNNIKSASK